MANLKLKNPAGGSLNFVSADGASDLTVTFPATTGTAMVSGNMPTYSYYANANQTFANVTFVKLACNTSDWDTTGGMYSNSTYRFTPTVAGYYQFNGQVCWNSAISSLVGLFKNGSEDKRGTFGQLASPTVSALIYCNGSTDYVELYAYQASGSSQNNANTSTIYNWFQGVLVRAA